MAMSRLLLLALMGTLCGAGCSDRSHKQIIADAVKRIEQKKLKIHVETLTQAGPRSVEDRHATLHTVRYIKSHLLEYGYQPVEEPLGSVRTVQGNNYSFSNIIAEHTGKGVSPRILELGAHYDTVDGSPGADDNASSVAAIIMSSRFASAVKNWMARLSSK